jgi:hypothetical protein
MTWNSAFIAPNQKNITRKFIITSKLFPNIMKVANCRNYILKPGLSIFPSQVLENISAGICALGNPTE